MECTTPEASGALDVTNERLLFLTALLRPRGGGRGGARGGSLGQSPPLSRLQLKLRRGATRRGSPGEKALSAGRAFTQRGSVGARFTPHCSVTSRSPTQCLFSAAAETPQTRRRWAGGGGVDLKDTGEVEKDNNACDDCSYIQKKEISLLLGRESGADITEERLSEKPRDPPPPRLHSCKDKSLSCDWQLNIHFACGDSGRNARK